MFDCLVVGDSIAVGTSQYLNCYVQAKVGDTTPTIHSKIHKKGKNEYVIVSAGSNDGKPQFQDYLNLRREFGSKVVWLMPPKNQQARLYIQSIARHYNDSVVEVQPFVGKDGIHPTGLGYRILANKVKISMIKLSYYSKNKKSV